MLRGPRDAVSPTRDNLAAKSPRCSAILGQRAARIRPQARFVRPRNYSAMSDSPTFDNAPPRSKPRPLSLIRSFVLADFLTLGNGFCGTGSILALMQYLATQDRTWLFWGARLLPLALFFDVADGRVARWRRRSSALGADLDSLADIISFGVAPATLGFAVGLRGTFDVAILLYFVACGISRLARFNATAADLSDDSGKVSHFEGTPIPTSILIVVLLWVLASQGLIHDQMLFGSMTLGFGTLHPLSLLYALSGSAMISTWRIPKL